MYYTNNENTTAEGRAIDLFRMDIPAMLTAYDNNELGEDTTIQLFQHIVDNGVAWILGESYQVMAKRLIAMGLVSAVPGLLI
jgi:hypothetical protein